MLGRSPFDAVGSTDPVANIRRGYFPYGLGGGGIPPGKWFNIWSHLSFKLKEQMVKIRCNWRWWGGKTVRSGRFARCASAGAVAGAAATQAPIARTADASVLRPQNAVSLYTRRPFGGFGGSVNANIILVFNLIFKR